MKTFLRKLYAGLLAAIMALLPGLQAWAGSNIGLPRASGVKADAPVAPIGPQSQGISSPNPSPIAAAIINPTLLAPLIAPRPAGVASEASIEAAVSPVSEISQATSDRPRFSGTESSEIHGFSAQHPSPASDEHRLIAHLLDHSQSYAALQKRLKDIRVSSEEATPEEISRRVTRYLGPYLEARAKKAGFSKAGDYSHWALSSPQAAAGEREKILEQIRLLRGYYAETWSWFFRQHGRWAWPLETYLERLIERRKHEKEPLLRIQDLGVGHGQEPYSLALLVHRALERAGEYPDRWRVEIAAYDVNVASLWSLEKAEFPWGSVTIPKHYSGPRMDRLLQDSEKPTMIRMHARLRSWIQPIFLDLNDVEQQDLLRQEPADIVFADHVLFHLQRSAARQLAEDIVQGNWGTEGERLFLSLGEALVAEIAPVSSHEQMPARLENTFPLVIVTWGHISHLIEAFVERWAYGLTWRVPNWVYIRKLGRAVQALWAWLPFRRSWRTALLVVGLAAGFHQELSRNPGHETALEPSLVELARREFGSRLGLKLGLISDARPYELDAQNRTLKLNIGWFIEDGTSAAAEREAVLKEIFERISARISPNPSQEESAGPSLFYPGYGQGEILFSGANQQGAILKIVRFPENRYRLLWLVGPRLYPYFGLKMRDDEE